MSRYPDGFHVKKKSGEPSSAMDSSNSEHIRVMIELVSAFARLCPTQFCLPKEKGVQESSISLLGLSHLEGSNLSGSRNTSGLRMIKTFGMNAMVFSGSSSPLTVVMSFPSCLMEPSAATGSCVFRHSKVSELLSSSKFTPAPTWMKPHPLFYHIFEIFGRALVSIL